jgi:pimeloyl-ACP methyl ester carboxylesterase
MHQFGSDQHQWDEIALWLQTGQPPAGSEWLPPLPEGMTFAVFTFDFRGHGESEGDANDDAGLLTDAQSALAFAKTQAGADPFRVITIGTSIGADGAVDACVALNEMAVAETQEHQGCLGAMAISPGSFLGVDYTNAATALLADPHLATVSCLAAEEDGDSPAACNAVTGERYQATIFPGNAHGTGLFDPGLALNLGDLILEFLTESLQLRQ